MGKIIFILATLFLLLPFPALAATPLKADSNNDCSVDGVDYLTWLNNYGKTTTKGKTEGNFTSPDQTVDGLDYVTWLNTYQKICQVITPYPADTTQQGLDKQGFLRVDGQRFFPFGYGEYPEQWLVNQGIANYGFNLALYLDNTTQSGGNHTIYQTLEEKGIKTFARDYMTSDYSACNLSVPCRWQHVEPFVSEVKNYANIIGWSPLDELGGRNGRSENLDPNFPKVLSEYFRVDLLKRPTLVVDKFDCFLEYNATEKKWVERIDLAQKNTRDLCPKYSERTTPATLKAFRDPNLTIPMVESGYFYRLSPSHPHYKWPQTDDLYRLFSGMEYARQETGGKKPIWTSLQILNEDKLNNNPDLENYWPTTEEIRSLFYGTLAHQARGLQVYSDATMGDLKSKTGEEKRVLEDIGKAIKEVKEKILPDFLNNNYDVSDKVVSKDRTKLDTTAFFSNNRFYLIAIDVTNNSGPQQINFPSLPQATTVELVGENKTINLNAGATSVVLDFLPHQTHVLKFTLSCDLMTQFLNLDLTQVCGT